MPLHQIACRANEDYVHLEAVQGRLIRLSQSVVESDFYFSEAYIKFF